MCRAGGELPQLWATPPPPSWPSIGDSRGVSTCGSNLGRRRRADPCRSKETDRCTVEAVRRRRSDRQGDRDGTASKEVPMRPIRTIAPLTLGLVALAVAACQSRPDRPIAPSRPRSTGPTPTTPPAGTAAQPATGHQPQTQPAPDPEIIVGLWPDRTWSRPGRSKAAPTPATSPGCCRRNWSSTSYGAADSACTSPSPVGSAPTPMSGRDRLEWVAELDMAQPVGQGAGGVRVITRTGSPVGSYRRQILSDRSMAACEAPIEEASSCDATPTRRPLCASRRPFVSPLTSPPTVGIGLWTGCSAWRWAATSPHGESQQQPVEGDHDAYLDDMLAWLWTIARPGP